MEVVLKTTLNSAAGMRVAQHTGTSQVCLPVREACAPLAYHSAEASSSR